jgi:hypothetical protein
MESKEDSDLGYELVGEHVSIFQRGRHWYAYYRLDGKPVRQSLKTMSKKQARTKALGIEREIDNGEARRPGRAPLIKDVIDEYIPHLQAMGRSEKTITKYQFTFKLMLELAAKRGISRINQIDLAFVDAFKLERTTHRVKPKKKDTREESKAQNNSQ